MMPTHQNECTYSIAVIVTPVASATARSDGQNDGEARIIFVGSLPVPFTPTVAVTVSKLVEELQQKLLKEYERQK